MSDQCPLPSVFVSPSSAVFRQVGGYLPGRALTANAGRFSVPPTTAHRTRGRRCFFSTHRCTRCSYRGRHRGTWRTRDDTSDTCRRRLRSTRGLGRRHTCAPSPAAGSRLNTSCSCSHRQLPDTEPGYMSRTIRKFERINSIRVTNGNFDSCKSCKWLVPSSLNELKFPFVKRIEFIRSKLPNFSAHVSGVTDGGTASGRHEDTEDTQVLQVL